MWRTTALHRAELVGSPDEDGPPPLPPGVSHDDLQPADGGVGPLFHRLYAVRATGTGVSPEELIARLGAHPNDPAPTELARFTKVVGTEGSMRVGDEFVVRMPGPWDGPVRVVDVTPTSFRLATLDGHLEAGQIEFRADRDGPHLTVAIESWARSGDRLSRLLYHRLRMAKEVQLHMWTSFLERAVKLSGGRMTGGVHIETRWYDADHDHGSDTGEPGRPEAVRVLDELHRKALNFEVGDRSGFIPAQGWRVDHYRQPLPAEPPGPPLPDGSWDVARRLLRDYEFADPAIVRAVFHRDGPLEDRDMLLEIRFHGLRFRVGVRVGGVVDETRQVDGRAARVWGWNYRTLQGHLEMGQMDYEVWKWLDTGEVEFHTCRFSRRARAGNPVVRLGVRIFGRRQQEKFARRACERMARLTAARLEGREDAGVPRVADEVDVRPS